MRSKFAVIVVLVILGCYPVVSAADLESKPKSSATGTTLSLVGTLAPAAVGFAVIWASAEQDNVALGVTAVALVFGGTVFGPGVGHKYAGDARRFWTGAGLRTLGWGAFALTAAAGFSDVGLSGGGTPWEFGAVVAITLTGISMIYDIATVGESVRKYNDKHGLGEFSVSPTVDLSRGGAGVRLSWQF